METKISESKTKTTPSSTSSTSSSYSDYMTPPGSMMKMPVSTPTLTPEIEKALKKNRDKKNVCILCVKLVIFSS